MESSRILNENFFDPPYERIFMSIDYIVFLSSIFSFFIKTKRKGKWYVRMSIYREGRLWQWRRRRVREGSSLERPLETFRNKVEKEEIGLDRYSLTTTYKNLKKKKKKFINRMEVRTRPFLMISSFLQRFLH